MSKKMMLIALPVAALLAIPSAAWTQEIHFSGATTFFGCGSAASIAAFNEPKISCTSTAATGSFTAGSSTTGEVKLTFTGCTAEFLGVKGNCNTTGRRGSDHHIEWRLPPDHNQYQQTWISIDTGDDHNSLPRLLEGRDYR